MFDDSSTAATQHPVFDLSHPELTPVNQTQCPTSTSDADRRGFSYVLLFLFGVPATCIILVTVIGNFFVLCFKARVGKRQTTLLIWNLGLADFFVGLFVLPLGVSYVVGGRWYFGRMLCKIWTSCDVIFCTASIVTLCIISVDRYIGVTRPLRYKLIVTKTKVKMANVAIWFFSITILLATIKYDQQGECYDPDICAVAYELAHVVHSVVFAFFLPATVTLLLYWKIYSVAKKREKGLMQGLMIAMGDNFLRDCFSVPLRMHCGNKDNSISQQQQIIRMHKKVAKTLGVVVSAFLLCWMPFFSLYLISYHCGACIPNLVLDITTWLGYCNSCINPLIYAFTLTEFRQSVRLMLKNFSACSYIRKKFETHEESTSIPRSDRAYSVAPSLEAAVIAGTVDNSDKHKARLRIYQPQRSVSAEQSSSLLKNESSSMLKCEPSSTAANEEDESMWSAKLYSTLVSGEATKL